MDAFGIRLAPSIWLVISTGLDLRSGILFGLYVVYRSWFCFDADG
jgi:hypothetical protein